MQVSTLLFQSFDAESQGLPGRPPFAQPEAPLWMGLHSLLCACDRPALLAALARQPQLRQILLQRAAASVQPDADAQPDAAVQALMATGHVLQARP